MKTKALAIVVLTVLLNSSDLTASPPSTSELLEKAIFTEETIGDLKAAIEIYRQILIESEANRSHVAQARYRLGMCHLKLGEKQKAIAAFQKLLDLFPEQKELATQARARMSALGHPTTAMAIRKLPMTSPGGMGMPSPDGRYLSDVNWAAGNMAVHDLETGEFRDLTDEGTWKNPNKFGDASIWSPDSRQIAYCWIDRAEGTDLRIVGLDGSEPRILYSNPELGYPWPRDWSRDGKYILALFTKKKDGAREGEKDHEDQIVLVSVADGSLRILKSLGERHTRNMSLSPDGRHVVFDLGAKHGEKRDIYLLATDGSRQVALIEHPADDSVPFWAPDGKRIVFVSDRSGSPGIWMLDVEDGKPKGNPVLVKQMGYHTRLMGFTRDGSLYYEVEGSKADIYTATLDFEAGKVLTPATKMSLPFAGWNATPFWSPDGKHLAYLSWRARQQVLVIRSVETGEERELAPAIERLLAPYWFAAPQWSPDGRSILVTGRVKGGGGLYLIDVQTGDFSAVVQQEPSEDHHNISAPKWPVYSKDGKQIYYVRNRSIFAHDLEARGEKLLYRATDDILWLARSPDGAQLAFFEKAESLHRPNVVKTVPASGGDPRELFRLVLYIYSADRHFESTNDAQIDLRSGAMVETEHPAEPLVAFDDARWGFGANGRLDQPIIDPLMIPFPMIVRGVLASGLSQRPFAEEDHSIETFILDRSDESLRVSVQVGRTVGQAYDFNTGILQEIPECFGELGIPVEDEEPFIGESPVEWIGEVPAGLHHPRLTWAGSDSSDVDTTGRSSITKNT